MSFNSLPDREQKATKLSLAINALSGKTNALRFSEQFIGCRNIDEPKKEVKKK